MRLALALAGTLLVGGGCQSALGNYFANRARDFGECWRAEVGPAAGLGVGVRGAGVLDVGVGFWAGNTAGWIYGEYHPFSDMNGGELWFPLTLFSDPSLALFHQSARIPHSHACWGLLPGASATMWDRSEARRRWIWTAAGPEARWARLHAFDLEVSVALFAGALRVGFSLGEFADFLLGWFGLDIAGDDTPWRPPHSH